MTTSTETLSTTSYQLRPYWVALLLGMLTLVYGFGIGIAFGVAEDDMKQALNDDAQAVMAEVYKGDAAKAKGVVDKAWSYMKRAHLHAGGLGAASLVMVMLLAFACRPTMITRGAALLLGVGALGYPIYWMVAGFAAPGLGGTGAAKESFAWLGMPTSGAVVIGTLATTVLVTMALARRKAPPAAA